MRKKKESNEKIYMKGFKAFNYDMTCLNKQYKENTIFEEDEAKICNCGMHFCKEPLDVLNYYPLVNEKGEISQFAEVEALDECKTDNDSKYCTKKLKIGAKLDFAKLVNIAVNFDYEKEKIEDTDTLNDNGGDNARIGSSGDNAQIGSSGYYARIGSSGYNAQIGSSGDNAQIGSSGYYARIGSSGDNARIGSSGYNAQIGSSGYYAQIGSSGYYARIGSSGYYARIGSSGYNAQIGSSGDNAQIGSSGDNARINSTGQDSVIMCAGAESMAKAKIGSWITLAEWEYDDKKERYVPINVVTKKVDGKEIKEDTYYELKDGKFMECDN